MPDEIVEEERERGAACPGEEPIDKSNREPGRKVKHEAARYFHNDEISSYCPHSVFCADRRIPGVSVDLPW
jgi:hypothetical protein